MRALTKVESGFLSQNLARALHQAGRDVAVIIGTPVSTGIFEGDSSQRDTRDLGGLLKVMVMLNPQVIYILAANSDISVGVADASLGFGDSLMTSVALRHATARILFQRLVFAPSLVIFGLSE